MKDHGFFFTEEIRGEGWSNGFLKLKLGNDAPVILDKDQLERLLDVLNNIKL